MIRVLGARGAAQAPHADAHESEGLQDVTTRLSDRLGIDARPSSACYTAGCCTCKSTHEGRPGLWAESLLWSSTSAGMEECHKALRKGRFWEACCASHWIAPR